MFGFVAALSSAATVIILIIASTSINLLNISTQNESAMRNGVNFLNIGGDTSGTSENGSAKNGSLGNNIVSNDDISNLYKSVSGGVVNIECSYGNNFSKSFAKRLLAINFIKLKKHGDNINTNISVTPLPLRYDNKGINNCYIKLGE